jgi:hypothetical protein
MKMTAPTKRYRVTYSVQFTAEIDVPMEPGVALEESFQDGISDIEIPEGGKHDSQYVCDSFKIDDIEDAETGKAINHYTGEVLA